MKIQQNATAFARLADDTARDNVVGRRKDGTRLDLATGSDPHEEPTDVPDALPPNSHVRKAGPRGHHDDNEIFRRGMPYVEFADGAARVGLLFCSFQATPNQFDAVFNDWMMNQQFPARADGTVAGADALMVGGSPAGPLVEIKHGGIFFVPPYDPEGVAATLTPKKHKKPKTGRLAINKVVRDPNDPGRRFERAGFIFELRDANGATVPGSQFTTASNGRGVCPVELPLDQSYTLVETFSPQPNVSLIQTSFAMDKPNRATQGRERLPDGAPRIRRRLSGAQVFGDQRQETAGTQSTSTTTVAARTCLEENYARSTTEEEMTRNTWPRDRYTGTGGGLSSSRGGGLYTGSGGGASTMRNGGLSSLRGGGLSTLREGGLSTLRGGGMSTLRGGGLSTLSGGGLSTSSGGGLSRSPGGGLYSGPCSNPYRSNIPPIDVFIRELRKYGYDWAANTLADAHGLNL